MVKAVARRSTKPQKVAGTMPTVTAEVAPAAVPQRKPGPVSPGKGKPASRGDTGLSTSRAEAQPASKPKAKAGSRLSGEGGAAASEAPVVTAPARDEAPANGQTSAPPPKPRRTASAASGKQGAAKRGAPASLGSAGDDGSPAPADAVATEVAPAKSATRKNAAKKDLPSGGAQAPAAADKSRRASQPEASRPSASKKAVASKPAEAAKPVPTESASSASIAKRRSVDQATRSDRANPPRRQSNAKRLTAEAPEPSRSQTTPVVTPKTGRVAKRVGVETSIIEPHDSVVAESKVSGALLRQNLKADPAKAISPKRTRTALAVQAKTAATKPPAGCGGCAPVKLGFLSDFIGFHLRLAQDASYRAFARIKEKDLVKPGRFPALAIIHLNPGISQSALGRAIARDKSTVSPLIKDLQKNGLINRKPSPNDRRSVTLVLTKKGERVLDRLHIRAREHENDLNKLVGASKIKLVGLLDKITAALTA